MDMNWALDVQSAQTLDFYAAMHGGKVAWDLGTLTGISAAVLSAHMKKVTRRTDVSGRMVLLQYFSTQYIDTYRSVALVQCSVCFHIFLRSRIIRDCVWHS